MKSNTSQKLEDFISSNKEEHIEIKNLLSQIFSQTKDTNGRLIALEIKSSNFITSEAGQKLANETKATARKECPAIKYYEENKVPGREWKIIIAGIILGILSSLVTTAIEKLYIIK